MIYDFKILMKRTSKKSPEVSVLVPFRADKRIFSLLKCLSKQHYKNFVLMLANDSKEPFLKESDFPENIDYIYYHSPSENYSPYHKYNFLIDQAATPFIAITESDCEPFPEWLSDLVPIVKRERTGIKGCEARPEGWCTANYLFPSDMLKQTKFDESMPVVGDYELGMRFEKKGMPIKIFNDKGVVFHNLFGRIRFSRMLPTARDDVYLAFKYRSPKAMIKKFVRNLSGIAFASLQMIAYIFMIPYFFVMFLFKRYPTV